MVVDRLAPPQPSEPSDSLTLLERQPWKARKLVLTQKAKPLPVPLPAPLPTLQLPPSVLPPPAALPINLPEVGPLSTPANIFGLSRHYFSSTFPKHDPEGNVTSLELVDETPHRGISHLGPYPNLNSFLLGDWYWGRGDKSARDFKELIDIIGDESFKPEDVRSTQWSKINAALSSSGNETEDWVDDTAGWSNESVTILVPVHERRVAVRDQHQLTAPRRYTVRGFRYRRLLDVIKEKLTSHNDHPHFHYEPFQLWWTPPGSTHRSRVYSELYTSDSFIRAHVELQASPPVQGCSLPRAIVALMLWSDATQLTSFSDTKLHPLYLFFGNESKYRRSSPSAHSGSHIAYFRSVSSLPHLLCFIFIDQTTASRRFHHICTLPDHQCPYA
jgi:hypothetical protein